MNDLIKRARAAMDGVTPEPWYIGAQNDALYVIDGPPSPSPYDGPIPKSYGPNVVCTPAWRDMPTEKNARFIAAARSLVPEMADAIEALQAQLAEVRDKALEETDYFGSLVVKARESAAKAAKKFPQPNYVTLKIAEEAGEVVRGAVHYAEGRMDWREVEGEIVQLIAMLIRFVNEGDQVNGITPPSAP